VIAPFAPGGAKRLRALLKLSAPISAMPGKVGTSHDAFVFFDNDTGWPVHPAMTGTGPLYRRFVAKIPNELDLVFSTNREISWLNTPGIKDGSPVSRSAEAWYSPIPISRWLRKEARPRRQGPRRFPRKIAEPA